MALAATVAWFVCEAPPGLAEAGPQLDAGAPAREIASAPQPSVTAPTETQALANEPDTKAGEAETIAEIAPREPAEAPPVVEPFAEPAELLPLPQETATFLDETPEKRRLPRGSIIAVERRPAFASGDQPTKEYYLSVGKFDDVRIGDVFHVFRELPIVDVTLGEPLEFLPVKIAEVRVAFVGDSSSVAHLLGAVDPRLLPKLDYTVIMVGDRVRRKIELPFSKSS